jgi:glutaredoxin
LQPGWNFCPYCARTTEAKKTKRVKARELRRELPPAPANIAEFKKG